MTEHGEAKSSGPGGTPHTAAPQESPFKGGSLAAYLAGWTPFLIGLVGMAVIGWIIWPALVYSKKQQPFQFNHAAHMDSAGMSCDDCHTYDDNGRFLGIPNTAMCLDCHTWTDRQNEDSPAETEFLEKFVNPDADELISEPQWYVYSKQPDCVFFSHVAHVEKGGLACEQCHGDHGESSSLPPFYENVITGYSKQVFDEMKMTDCGDCHARHNKPENNACFVCHK